MVNHNNVGATDFAVGHREGGLSGTSKLSAVHGDLTGRRVERHAGGFVGGLGDSAASGWADQFAGRCFKLGCHG